MESKEISYRLMLGIHDNVFNNDKDYTKDFTCTIQAEDNTLYDNSHVIRKDYILNYFKDEINEYITKNNITIKDIEINSYDVASLTENVEVYFESNDAEGYDFHPSIMAYIKATALNIAKPILNGVLIDDIVIKWSWEDDGYIHQLYDESDNLIKTIPLGVTSYIEDNLKYDTGYTRKLISTNSSSTSEFSNAITVYTAKERKITNLTKYTERINDNYVTAPMNIINERLKAFKSGIGDRNDCLLTKKNNQEINTKTNILFSVYGDRHETIDYYPKVNFGYRYTLKGKYLEYTRAGHIKYKIGSIPKTSVRVRLYRYVVRPVKVKWTVSALCVYLTKSGSNIVSRQKEFSVSGTYSLAADNNYASYNSNGFATMNSINKNVNGKTLKTIISEVANQDPDIKAIPSSLTKYKQFVYYRITDDYATNNGDVYNNLAGQSISDEGTFRITNTEYNGKKISDNDVLQAKGVANAQLYEYELIKDIDLSKTNTEIFNPMELNHELHCVCNRNLTYNGPGIITKVELIGSYKNVSLTTNNDGSYLNLNESYSKELEYNFSNNNFNKIVSIKDLFGNMNDTDRDFINIITVEDCTPNIYFNNSKIKKGQVITLTENANSNLVFESKRYAVEKEHTDVMPSLDEECLHGTVNGIEDKNIKTNCGKKDFIVQCPKFYLPQGLYDIEYGIKLEGATDPFGQTINYFFASSMKKVSNIGEDIITFGCEATKAKSILITDKIFETKVPVHITSKYDIGVQAEYNLQDTSIINKYYKFTAKAESENHEIIIVYCDENITPINSSFLINAIVKYTQYPGAKWNPSIHNGYYYINQHEYFIYSNYNAKDGKAKLQIIPEEQIKTDIVSFTLKIVTDNKMEYEKSFNYKIKLDATKYEIADSINDLIKDWLNKMGYTLKNIDTITTSNVDNRINVFNTSNVISTDESPDLKTVFDTWEKIAVGANQYQSQISAWKWDETQKKMFSTVNSDILIGFHGPTKTKKYKALLRVSGNDHSDNDWIGFIIAFRRINGIGHMLMAVRSLNSSQIDEDPINDWGIYYNTTNNKDTWESALGKRIAVANKKFETVTGNEIWSDFYPEGSYIKIERDENKIIAYCSPFGQEEISEDSKIELSLNSGDLQIFKEPSSYGFCCLSQNCSTFDKISITDSSMVNKPVTIASKRVETETVYKNKIELTNENNDANILPQQFAPIVVENQNEDVLQHIENISGDNENLTINENIIVENETKTIMLKFNNIDLNTLKVQINDNDTTAYNLVNNALIFNEDVKPKTVIKCSYKLIDTFAVNYDIENKAINITINSDKDFSKPIVNYEHSLTTNLKSLDHLSLNPVYNTDYEGFFYIDYDKHDPYTLNMYSTAKSMFCKLNDTLRIYIEVLDFNGNPVENENIEVQCKYGNVLCDSYVTDINGVVALTYTAPLTVCKETIVARCKELSTSININIKEREL